MSFIDKNFVAIWPFIKAVMNDHQGPRMEQQDSPGQETFAV
jgi:hypothetical protein